MAFDDEADAADAATFEAEAELSKLADDDAFDGAAFVAR